MSTRSTHENQQQFSQENLRKKNSHQNLRGKCRTKFLGKIWEQNFPGMFIYWIYWFSHMEKRFLTHERTFFFFLFTHESKFLSLIFLVPHLLSVHLMDKWKNPVKKKMYFNISLGSTHEISWEQNTCEFFFFFCHTQKLSWNKTYLTLLHTLKKKHFRTWKKMEHKKKFAGPFSPDRRIEGAPQHTRATHSRL